MDGVTVRGDLRRHFCTPGVGVHIPDITTLTDLEKRGREGGSETRFSSGPFLWYVK